MLRCGGGCHTSLVATSNRNRAKYELLALRKNWYYSRESVLDLNLYSGIASVLIFKNIIMSQVPLVRCPFVSSLIAQIPSTLCDLIFYVV